MKHVGAREINILVSWVLSVDICSSNAGDLSHSQQEQGSREINMECQGD